jgi:hypothetical protein
VKITILREKKEKKPINEALPAALAAAAPYIAKAIGSVMDDESEETAEEIVDQSQNKPIKVDSWGGEFRDIKRILQAIQAQLIKMGGPAGGDPDEAAGEVAPMSVSEDLKKTAVQLYRRNFKKI